MCRNILNCVCRPRIVSNASQTKWQILPTPKRPRIIQLVFLSKYWLLIAPDTVLRGKRDWAPRDWFLSPNLPETRYKVKSHHSISQSTSFNRELRWMRSITNIFPEPYKISVKHFLSETAQNPMGLGLKPEFPESRPKRKRIRRTSKCSSFSRGLRATPFGASVFIHPQRKWFHSEID